MSPAPVELAIVRPPVAARGSDRWLRAARRARWLAWASLVWMTLEGAAGVLAGIEANSISVLTWAASSAVEGLASAIVIWRFTGRRTLSEHAERRAQRWVAASFFLLAPYFLYEAINRLIAGTAVEPATLAIALTASSVVLMPLLGWAKLRLGRRLDSGATAGEGVQNLLCAGQALAALIAVVGAGAGAAFLDPLAALAIAGIAAKEGIELWRGEECACHTIPGLDADATPAPQSCRDDCCSGI
jgi:divalent metal cation (Fe/Co/Zn/Cd) transporter